MKSRKVELVMGAMLLIALLIFVGWFIYTFLQADAEYQSGILALIGVVAAGIIAAMSAKKRERDARHFDEKRKGYTEFVDTFMEFFLATQLGKSPPSIAQLAQSFVEFKKLLLIWADADVIKMWNKVESEFAIPNQDPILVLVRLDELLRMMRKDLGKDDSQLEKGELVALMLKAEEKHKVRNE